MRALLFIGIGLFGGVAAGFYTAWGDYVGRESRMGLYTDRSDPSEVDIGAHFGGGDSSEQSGTGGKAEVVGPVEYDFGTMRRGAEGSHDFVIKNVGTGTLSLKVISSTCKCTVGTLKESVLEPGETTEVTMAWKTRQEGNVFSQSATLRTTDPDNAELKLYIRGDLTDAVLVDKKAWALGDFRLGEKEEVRASLYIFEETPLHILEADWARDWISEASEVEILDRALSEEERERYPNAVGVKELVVQLPEEIRQGPVLETFRLKMALGESVEDLDPEDEILHEIELNGTVVGPISMVGSSRLKTEDDVFRLAMGDTRVGEPLSRKVFVSVRKDANDVSGLRIEGVNPEGVLEASLGEPIERPTSLMYPLEVTVKETSEPIERNGTSPKDWGVVILRDPDEKVAPVKLYVSFRVLDLVDAR